MSEKKMLSPKLDVVSHMLFGEQESKRITKSLIEDVIQEKIETIELEKTPYLWGTQAEDKVGIIDVRAKINNNTHVDIEMQMVNQEKIEKRILYYWSKLYSKQLKKNKKYSELERTICILFINEKIGKLRDLPMQTTWKIIETKERKTILTNDLEIHIIELPKLNRNEDVGELKKWVLFLNDPEGEAIKKMAKEDKEIKEAVEKLEEISSDEAKERLAELREKYILDYNTNMDGAEKRGIEKGLKQGIEQGIEQGKREEIRQIAKKMLIEKVDIQTIINVTGLSKEEIEKL